MQTDSKESHATKYSRLAGASGVSKERPKTNECITPLTAHEPVLTDAALGFRCTSVSRHVWDFLKTKVGNNLHHNITSYFTKAAVFEVRALECIK